MDEIPGNSHAARMKAEQGPKPENSEATSDPKKVEKIVEGRVTKRPKPLGNRLKDMFLAEGSNFGGHLVENVVVPMLKDMALSIVTQMGDHFRQGVEGALFGESRTRVRATTSYGTGRPTVNYQRISTSSMHRDNNTRPPYSSNRAIRRSNIVEQIIVETREDGDMVIEELDAMIDSLGYCTVADYYSLTNAIKPQSTDEEWGWSGNDLRNARVSKLSPDEFVIRMPNPRPIQN